MITPVFSSIATYIYICLSPFFETELYENEQPLFRFERSGTDSGFFSRPPEVLFIDLNFPG